VTEATPTARSERRVDDRPLRRAIDVAAIAENMPLVVRTVGGMAVVGIGVNVIGVAVISAVIAAMNARATSHQLSVLLTATGIMVAFSVATGVVAATLVQRRTLRWLLRGDPPSRTDARRALRLPRDLAFIAAVLWLVGGGVVALSAVAVGEDAQTVSGICGGIVLAGLASAGLTYLIAARFSRPVARLALAAVPPKETPIVGVRWRLLLIWVLTSGTPVVGLMLILTAPRSKTHVLAVALVVCVVTLIVGGLATALSARAIGEPLHDIVAAFERVGDGDLSAELDIEDAGEIGLVQAGFNDMVEGLRERERVMDLFGRHVGSPVAEQAINEGVTLEGESRDVVALFVDITGSTRLTRETEPAAFVAMLNRFFEVVVEEVEANGGLLNKFEGDAALCIFGAPVALDDPGTAALRAARAIRDRVAEMGELEIGVGVAAGPVIAGQIGTTSRLEYTIIGDAVNEAARLTDLAKRVEGRILASESAVECASDEERKNWVRGRVVRLRGRDAPTNSYRSVVASDSPLVPFNPFSLARRIADRVHAVTEDGDESSHHRE
jgi:adenylate cyclase